MRCHARNINACAVNLQLSQPIRAFSLVLERENDVKSAQKSEGNDLKSRGDAGKTDRLKTVQMRPRELQIRRCDAVRLG